ncbi:hypothetical protein UFOVP449_227 [uncultured Caudovirales phage]|uniref:Uncharacterized protein n=1 Tax=uncultured Caudovirales phage TaxID=2100421 RepID=A0A6J5MBC4_9CAUD|nr:hypothetical protein UFOVP449_227 [uncultured Caudovirales phage]
MNQCNEQGEQNGYWEWYHENGELDEKRYYARM